MKSRNLGYRSTAGILPRLRATSAMILNGGLRVPLACLLLLSLGQTAPGRGQGPSEYAIKAAFILNFVRFTEWPAGASGSITIGVVGPSSCVEQMQQTIGSKTLDGRKIVAKGIVSPKNSSGCQVLFIAASSMSRASELSALKGQATLIVGESDGFARKFGHIGFVPEGNKIAFEVHASSAKSVGIQISSKLLQLAKWVG